MTRRAGLRRLVIVGAGLLGTSIALAARQAWPGAQIVGVDRRASRRAPRPFDRLVAADDFGARGFGGGTTSAPWIPELVVLACPVDAIVAWLPRLAVTLPPDTPVTDVGSTKRTIMAAARAARLRGFVGGHPMAGGTRPGPTDARAYLCHGRPWLLVPGPRPLPAARARVLALVRACGAQPVLLPSAAAHDRLVAAVSHLPQLAATTLMAEVGESAGPDGLALAGPGLHDATRLAASDASVWVSLLASNADLVAPRLRALARRLEALAAVLDDPRALAEAFARGNTWRATLQRRAHHL